MKILRLSAMALTAALGCALGCGASSSGCGGTNLNANSNVPTITCGAGTVQVNGVCQIPQQTTTN